MSSKGASYSDGTSKVQHLELPSTLPRLGEWDLAAVIPLGGWTWLCSTPGTAFATKVAGASSLTASPLLHFIPKRPV